jgi:hypothetical protein
MVAPFVASWEPRPGPSNVDDSDTLYPKEVTMQSAFGGCGDDVGLNGTAIQKMGS